MTFHGILFRRGLGQALEKRASAPPFFSDLNLDQIVAAITAGKEDYELKPFFYLPLKDPDDIVFRHEVTQDLEQPQLFEDIKTFNASMHAMREHLAQAEKLHYERQKERWILDAVNIYCDAVTRLAEDLSRACPKSRGLSGLREYVARHVASEGFTTLRAQGRELAAKLATIHYSVLINGGFVQVRRYDGEPDYGAEVVTTFERFEQGTVKEYAFSFDDSVEMNHVEALILDQVVKLYPEIFSELQQYVSERGDFADPTIIAFDREVQFYVAYLEYLEAFRKAGLTFCYPRVSRAGKEVYDCQGFDLALAGKLIREEAVPVCNDFHLSGQERIIVVSGPNQGGKTTFARTFGQLHYLASLGCLVPGTRAQLFLFDSLFTHFEREEDVGDLRGKLQDDLVRVHDILEHATPDSIIIMNEVFTSTTSQDADILSRRIAARIMLLDSLCVWVTFLDELASLSDTTVSMVSTVVPENPTVRTYKIVRRPADGLAYALSIAEKHGLTYDRIRGRIGS